MRVGVLRETKDRELRVAVLPSAVRSLAGSGHNVFVEAGAGSGSGFPDEAYQDAGATILGSARSSTSARTRSVVWPSSRCATFPGGLSAS